MSRGKFSFFANLRGIFHQTLRGSPQQEQRPHQGQGRKRGGAASAFEHQLLFLHRAAQYCGQFPLDGHRQLLSFHTGQGEAVPAAGAVAHRA